MKEEKEGEREIRRERREGGRDRDREKRERREREKRGERETPWAYTLARGVALIHPSHRLRAFPFCLLLSLELNCGGDIHDTGD